MRATRLPTRLTQITASGLSLLLLLSLSSPLRATDAAEGDTSASLTALVEGGPEGRLGRDASGTIEALVDGLDPFAAAIVTEAARTLNEASAAGYLVVSDDFTSVRVTKVGRTYVKDLVAQQTAGCDRVTNVSADWLGFHVEMRSECTQQEFEARVGLQSTDQTEHADATKAPLAAPGSQIVPMSHDNLSCLVHVFLFGVATVGLLVFLAAPPFGWLFWVAWGVTGIGLFAAWFFANDACFGVHDVDKKVRVGSVVYRYNCTFAYNSDWRWDGHQWVPVYERWNC